VGVMATEVTIKKIGNSLGVIFPRDFVKNKKIKKNEKVLIEVVKEADLRPLFGILKTKETGQHFKDMVRKGWEQ
jgi:antitoxin component of MazEF toxin-antitoxin module